MSKIVSLDIYFNDCLLSDSEIDLIMTTVQNLKHLKMIVLKLCHNNVGFAFVDSLKAMARDRHMETFDLSLCE